VVGESDTDTDAKALVAHDVQTSTSHAAFQRRFITPPPNSIVCRPPPARPDDMGRRGAVR